jgi:hypothetical protein
MTVYHAAVTPDGYGDRINTFASTDEQEIYEAIWSNFASDWMAEYDYDESHPEADEILLALEHGDYKSAVQTYPFHKGEGRYVIDTLKI